jgi:hypothetical protein
VVTEDHHEGGATPEVDVRALVGGEPVELGHVTGGVGLAPATEPGAVVLALQEGAADIYRCVSAAPGWSACPAATALATRDRARAAADELATRTLELMAERVTSAHCSTGWAPTRDRWLAAARPAPRRSAATRSRPAGSRRCPRGEQAERACGPPRRCAATALGEASVRSPPAPAPRAACAARAIARARRDQLPRPAAPGQGRPLIATWHERRGDAGGRLGPTAVRAASRLLSATMQLEDGETGWCRLARVMVTAVARGRGAIGAPPPRATTRLVAVIDGAVTAGPAARAT